jgi:uncharacterized protein YdeI (YjbR/CyaY-like superfamily)
MNVDREERTVAIPGELRGYADWIGQAKKPETRIVRARKAIAMIAERVRTR